MRNLRKYVKGINRFAAIFGQKEINLAHLSNDMAKDLLNRLEGELSPENLCCDGELSAAKVRTKARMLNGAVQDLIDLGYRDQAPKYLMQEIDYINSL